MLFSHPTALKSSSEWKWKRLAGTVLGLFFVGLFGGLALSSLERPTELRRYLLNRAMYEAMTDSVDFEHCHDPAFKDLSFCAERAEFTSRLKAFFQQSGNELEDQKHWTFSGAFFFMLKLASTVGYGAQGSPLTNWGQMFTMGIGILAIPLFGYFILMSATSVLSVCVKVFFPNRREEDITKNLWGIFCLVVLVILWFGGAAIFALLEGWSYNTSVYVCFVTLSTVGFSREQPSTFISRVFFALYIFLALGLSTGLLRYAARNVEALPILRLSARDERRTFRLHPVVAIGVVLLVCVLGGVVFPALEREEELRSYARHRLLYKELQDLAFWDGCKREHFADLKICRNREYFKAELATFFGPHTENAMVDQEHWTFLGSCFFTLSVASTIGYGLQTPQTEGGRLATVLTGLIAIPMFGYAMLQWAHFTSINVRRLLERLVGGGKFDIPVASHVLLIALLWLGGAGVYLLLEDWTVIQAFYFCFVTLSSAGFATAVPYTTLARCFTVIYILAGIGLCASLIALVVDRLEGTAETASLVPAEGQLPRGGAQQGGGASAAPAS